MVYVVEMDVHIPETWDEDKKKIFHAKRTGNFPEMAEIREMEISLARCGKIFQH